MQINLHHVSDERATLPTCVSPPVTSISLLRRLLYDGKYLDATVTLDVTGNARGFAEDVSESFRPRFCQSVKLSVRPLSCPLVRQSIRHFLFVHLLLFSCLLVCLFAVVY